ncbi:hypothetical protein FGG08_001838 [Glutinoglossum americanum]|uniref:Ubiquitin-like domain-containing protein n=1 Tax=Glutinoglossum americanum TaxID=1670608 RepID=A0A9P8I682_9PEZI|nr:hypothetical protein FGG08_001838 [Glutinoglossum americanum]
MSSMTPPLNLTIRFSTSAPDLPLTIPSPQTKTPLFLKQRIRLLRPAETSTRRLRLFHAGKTLQDTVPLADALRSVFPPLLPPPPPRQRHVDPKGKGKAREAEESPPQQQQQDTIFLSCSVGDELTPAELTAEQTAASTPSATTTTTNATPPPPPQPRGFDRLLTAGFTPAEVAQLRAQFEQLQSYSYTPDTMPGAAEMRLLEDRWIDESVAPGGIGGGVGEDEIGVPSGGYEDMLLGTMVGFFWPLGAVVWLLREEGVWSKRRQMAVVAGMLVNVAFSVLRNTS